MPSLVEMWHVVLEQSKMQEVQIKRQRVPEKSIELSAKVCSVRNNCIMQYDSLFYQFNENFFEQSKRNILIFALLLNKICS